MVRSETEASAKNSYMMDIQCECYFQGFSKGVATQQKCAYLPRVPNEDAPQPDSSPVKILVIEDDAGDQGLLLHQLKKSGIKDRVLCVEDGNDAMDLVRTGARKLSAVAAIFLDLSLPGVNGLLLLEAIRSNVETALLPVFVMSGSTDPHDEVECRRLGASFIPKRLLTLPSFRATISEIFHPSKPAAADANQEVSKHGAVA